MALSQIHGSSAHIAVDMMDNASALPTCPQRQQQQKTAARNLAENYPHEFAVRGLFIGRLLW